jgi:short-subunit dehydrogenase
LYFFARNYYIDVGKMRKVALITGGTSGIGKALTIKFGKEGYAVVFTGRNEARMEEVEQQLSQLEIDHLGLRLDAAAEADNQKMVQETMERYGRLDVLICNAGVSMRALFEDLSLDTFRQVMEINFYGAVYATKYALPEILKNQGKIIAISSINGHRGTPARSAYTASKYALEGFFEALRTEVMKRGVNVLVVSPGFTGTNIRNNALTGSGTAQGASPRDESKMMRAETVAEKTYQAMRKGRRDLVLTRQGKLAVWLNKFFPAKMDQVVYQVMAKEPDSPLK